MKICHFHIFKQFEQSLKKSQSIEVRQWELQTNDFRLFGISDEFGDWCYGPINVMILTRNDSEMDFFRHNSVEFSIIILFLHQTKITLFIYLVIKRQGE